MSIRWWCSTASDGSLEEWGAGVLEDAHGIFIDGDDNVFCTERNHHCTYKFNAGGELVMTIGPPGKKGVRDGDPFNLPTDASIASGGDLFISDGYGNARVHKYTADGRHLLSWGEWGTGPRQFNLSHAVRVDRHDRVWVCDRSNERIQIFDSEGRYLTEWAGILKPDNVHFNPVDGVVYVAGVLHEVGVYTMAGERICTWGGGHPSTRPGEFLACRTTSAPTPAATSTSARSRPPANSRNPSACRDAGDVLSSLVAHGLPSAE